MNAVQAYGVPRHRDGARLRVEANGTTILETPGDAPRVALNPTALALWELCDGETTVQEMVAAAADLFAAADDRLHEDIQRVLAELTEAGLLEWTPTSGAAPQVLPAPRPEERA